MNLRAVAFDIDGTLYSNPLFYLRAVPHGLRNFRLMRHFGRVRKSIRQIEAIDGFHSLQANMLAESMGVSFSVAERLIEERLYRKSEDLLVGFPLFPGVRSTLRELRDAGLKLGAASDFPVERKLVILGLEGVWDCAYSTEDTGYLKPDPRAFAPLSECLEAPAAEILYVGNSYSYDILGASKAGFKTAHVTRRPPENTVADVSFRRYTDLLRWILDRAAAAVT